MKESGDKFVGAGIGDETIDLAPESVRVKQFATLGEAQQFLIGRRAPEEIGEADGELAIVELASFVAVVWLVEVEETGRGEYHGKRQFDGFFKRITSGATGFVDFG